MAKKKAALSKATQKTGAARATAPRAGKAIAAKPTTLNSKAAKPKAAPAKAAPKAMASARTLVEREVDRDDAPPRGKHDSAAKKGAKSKAAARAVRKDDGEAPLGIGAGDSAPSFVLKDHSGNLVSSESLRGSPYLIYFYPKDDTPGCTLEACGFRDSASRFSAKGVRVLGVSPDSPETHARFRKKYGLTFPLLSDPEKTLAKAYGVWVKKLNYGREYMGVERSTFFVDRAGVVKRAWRRVRVPGHVDEVVHSV